MISHGTIFELLVIESYLQKIKRLSTKLHRQWEDTYLVSNNKECYDFVYRIQYTPRSKPESYPSGKALPLE